MGQGARPVSGRGTRLWHPWRRGRGGRDGRSGRSGRSGRGGPGAPGDAPAVATATAPSPAASRAARPHVTRGGARGQPACYQGGGVWGGGAVVSHWSLPRLADWRRADGQRADWLGPEVRLWGDARRPAQRGDTDKELPQRLPGGCPSSPRAPRAGAAREGGGGAAALGALLEAGNASLAERPPTLRPPRPAARSNWRWGTRRAGGAGPVSRSLRARQPMGGPGERG